MTSYVEAEASSETHGELARSKLSNMHMRFLRILIVLFASGAAAFAKNPQTTNDTAATRALRNIEAARSGMVLYSINPEKIWREKGVAPDRKYFCGYRVIGSAEIASAQERALVLNAFAKSVFAFVDGEYLAGCFAPRHGMRLVIDGRTIDFLICFECAQVEAKGFGKIAAFLINGEAQPVFDEVLRAHRVKLARKPED